MTVQSQSKQGEELELIREFCEVAENIRGHYGIEECAGVGGPATEWDELQDALAQLARDGREFLSAKQEGGTRVSVWRLVSCYSDGDRIIEATFKRREDAERMIPRVYEFRSDQTEAPVDVVVEEA